MVTKKPNQNNFFTINTLVNVLIFKVFFDLSLIFAINFYRFDGGQISYAFLEFFTALYSGYIVNIGSLIQGYLGIVTSSFFWTGEFYLAVINTEGLNFSKWYLLIPIICHLAILYSIRMIIGKYFSKGKDHKNSTLDNNGDGETFTQQENATLDNKTSFICFMLTAFYALPFVVYGFSFGWVIDYFMSKNGDSDYKILLSLLCYAGAFIVISTKIFGFARRNISSDEPKSILFKSMFQLASSGVAKASQSHLDTAGHKVGASNQRRADLTSKAGLIRSDSEERRLQSAKYDRNEDRGGGDFVVFIILGLHYLVNLITYGVFKLFGLHKSMSIGK